MSVVLYLLLFGIQGFAQSRLDLGFQLQDPSRGVLEYQSRQERYHDFLLSESSNYEVLDMGLSATQSEKTAWTETVSSLRTTWLKDQFVKTKMSESLQLGEFRQLLTALNNKEIIVNQKKLKGGDRILLIDRGIDQPTEIVLRQNQVNGSDKIIFSTRNLPQSFWHNVESFVVSPNETRLAVVVSRDGSLDNYFVYVVDVDGNLLQPPFEISFTDLAWKGENKILYDAPFNSAFYSATHELDVSTGQTKVNLDGAFISAGPWTGELIKEDKNEYVLVVNQITGQKFKGSVELASGIYKFFAGDDKYLYAYNCCEMGRSSWGKILRFSAVDGSPADNFIATNNRKIQSYFYKNNYFIVVHRLAEDQKIVVFNNDGVLLREASLPINGRLLDVSWSVVGDILQLKMQSATKQELYYDWVLNSEKAFLGLEQELAKADGFELVSRIEKITSFDGTSIPVRMVYKKDLPRDNQRPVYMHTYGGFNIVNSIFDARYDGMMLEFLKRGGVLVGTAVRGGGELGPEWHKSAVRENKIITMRDLIAVSEFLVKSGWTSTRMIVSTGTSNGGFVVASAARMAPDKFGFVIPIGGVHDQLRFHQLDRWGRSWMYDFGDVSNKNHFGFMKNQSPLEIEPQKDQGSEPIYLVTAGLVDSRVNSVHSMKLHAVLEAQSPGRSHLMLVDQAGHWPHSILLQDAIGIETGAQIWSRMFSHFGWQL